MKFLESRIVRKIFEQFHIFLIFHNTVHSIRMRALFVNK